MKEELTMNISENFTIEEMEASETAAKLGIINQVATFEQRDALFALVRSVLQPLRTAYGKPLHINSGFRSKELNRAVGGVETSQHTKGEAADVAAENPYQLAMLARTLNLPYDQMILYPTFVHFSHKLSGEQRGSVLYNKSYKGKRL